VGTNVDAIASALAEAGVEYMFGLPGGEVVALLAACRKAGVRFYLTGTKPAPRSWPMSRGRSRDVPECAWLPSGRAR